MATGDKWRIAARDEDIWLVRRSRWGGASALPRGAKPLAAAAAVARVGAWFPMGWGADERMAAEICFALEGDFPSRDVPESGWLQGTLRRALRDGRLVAVRMPHVAPMEGFAQEADEPPTPRREVREEKTWVRIVLVDDSDPPQPVPFERYQIELPDGSVREGMLDAGGAATLTGIDAGMCVVSFPGFDACDWARI